MSEPIVRVSFVPTLDERADVAVRFGEGSPALRRRNRLTIAITTAIGAIGAGVAVYFVLRWFDPGLAAPRALAAPVIVALFLLWRLPTVVRRDHARRTRNAMAERYGEDTRPFVVELHADRVVADAGSFKIEVLWRDVLVVERTGDDVEIRCEHTLIVVRKRAFADPEAARTFRDTADGLMRHRGTALGQRRQMSEPILPGPFARAAFDMTLDERVDVTCRHADLLPSVRRQRYLGLSLLALVAGALTFGAARLLSPDGSPWAQAAATLVTVAVVASFGPRLWRRTRERATRRVLVELTGEGPVPFVVELHAIGITITSGETVGSVPWHEVASVRENGGDVELVGPATLIVVRGRAFASAADAAGFRATAERLRTAGPAAAQVS